jgi:hypothetical protein
MRIVLRMERRHFLLALLVLAAISAVIVFAAVDKSRAWHTGDAVEVSVAGTVMSLQQALDNGSIPAAFANEADHADRADYSDDADSVNGFTRDDFP